jgi:hypothetical protein
MKKFGYAGKQVKLESNFGMEKTRVLWRESLWKKKVFQGRGTNFLARMETTGGRK